MRDYSAALTRPSLAHPQKNVVKRKDLCAWEGEYGGTTAEGIAKRVINKYNPSNEELSRVVSRGRVGGKKAENETAAAEDMAVDCSASTAEVISPQAEMDTVKAVESAENVAVERDLQPATDESATRQKKGPGNAATLCSSMGLLTLC